MMVFMQLKLLSENDAVKSTINSSGPNHSEPLSKEQPISLPEGLDSLDHKELLRTLQTQLNRATEIEEVASLALDARHLHRSKHLIHHPEVSEEIDSIIRQRINDIRLRNLLGAMSAFRQKFSSPLNDEDLVGLKWGWAKLRKLRNDTIIEDGTARYAVSKELGEIEQCVRTAFEKTV